MISTANPPKEINKQVCAWHQVLLVFI